MAAAFHWEARRRQMQMERRLQLRQERETPGGAGQQQQEQEEEARGEGKAKELPPASSTWAPGPKPAVQDAACRCNTAHPPQQSGKLLRRYSNMQYIQQW